ncbi:hypothetical protein AHAS_Ahas20G0148600 [Arachis hypogaea]
MSKISLLSIHYNGQIVYDKEDSIVLRSTQRVIAYTIPKVNSLTMLKNLILHSIGQQHTKRVKKIYYRYPSEVDNVLFLQETNVHLLELFVFLVELGGRGSSADTINDSPLSRVVRRNIRRTMVDLNVPPEGSQKGSNVEHSNDGMMQSDIESHESSAIRDR